MQVVMEDQLLRAAKLTPRPGSMTDVVRRALSRVYYSYKPQFYAWGILIIVRKFGASLATHRLHCCTARLLPRSAARRLARLTTINASMSLRAGIALSSLIFSNNAAYNLTFCCLVLFVAFALHMRSLPYMPESEFDAVLVKVAARAKVEAEWQRLRALVLERGKQLKKATRDNTLTVRFNTYAGMSKYVGDGFLSECLALMAPPVNLACASTNALAPLACTSDICVAACACVRCFVMPADYNVGEDAWPHACTCAAQSLPARSRIDVCLPAAYHARLQSKASSCSLRRWCACWACCLRWSAPRTATTPTAGRASRTASCSPSSSASSTLPRCC